ncbi:unnamed protein product [Durusdinium trenchii]|uniref:Uncharacterized protein n=1 Tax=Durusdinium trenchii TaxID=1381693 RepID=A0ABP0SBV3_9DINO
METLFSRKEVRSLKPLAGGDLPPVLPLQPEKSAFVAEIGAETEALRLLVEEHTEEGVQISRETLPARGPKEQLQVKSTCKPLVELEDDLPGLKEYQEIPDQRMDSKPIRNSYCSFTEYTKKDVLPSPNRLAHDATLGPRYVREVNRYLALVEEQPQLFEKYIQQRRGQRRGFSSRVRAMSSDRSDRSRGR